MKSTSGNPTEAPSRHNRYLAYLAHPVNRRQPREVRAVLEQARDQGVDLDELYQEAVEVFDWMPPREFLGI